MNKSIIGKIMLSLSFILFSIILLHGRITISYLGALKIYGTLGLIALILSIMGTLLFVTLKSAEYTLLGLVSLVFLIFTPQLLAKLPIFAFVYRIYGHVLYIVSTGHINPNVASLRYQTWPGVMILGAILENVSDINVFLLLSMPILFYLVAVPLVYSILNKILRVSYSESMIATLFFMFNFYGFLWFVPESAALLIMFSGLYLTLVSLLARREIVEISLILYIFTFSIVIFHFLTSVSWFILLLVIFIFVSISSHTHSQFTKKIQLMLFSLIIAFLASQFYWIFNHTFTINLFRERVNELVRLLQAISATKRWQTLATTGQTPYDQVLKVKMYFTYLTILISLIGMFLSIFVRQYRKLTLLFLLIVFSYSISIPLIGGSYGGEIASRVLNHIRYLLPIFVGIAFLTKPWGLRYKQVVTLLLPILLVLQVYCTYGNIVMDYISPNEISGVFYISTHQFNKKVYVIPDPIWDVSPKFLIGWDKKIVPINLQSGKVPRDGYLGMSTRLLRKYKFMHGSLPNNLINIINNGSSDIIYDSSNHYPPAYNAFEVIKLG